MDESVAARVGYNEALFRFANEEVGRLALEAKPDRFEIVCECGHPECRQQIIVSPEAYRKVRSNPAWFFVRPGHEIEDVEQVVPVPVRQAGIDSYAVVEKRDGLPKQIAEETRSRG